MGIPKFYRWISERYPCLSEKIREYQIPEFDNLYLDMNGIIHACSHPNDDDIHLRIPEEHIFRDIFRYLDFLFKMIKPKKMFFMAIDGVAPRAKMNQQRGRRFRSARLAVDQEAEAIKQGEILPTEDRFDSNCITPGTEFMARLHDQLKYFVEVKISTDPLWQRPGLTVILSGHNVPGEGEHKIMDFIRHIRSNESYDPETRHCLYGLDADLIMLGLSTHELRFSLLREEVKFTRPKKNKKKKMGGYPETGGGQTFDLTNVSIYTNENGEIGAPVLAANLQPPVVEGRTFAAALQAPAPPAPVQVNAGDKADINNLLAPSNYEGVKHNETFRPPIPEKTTFFLLHISLLRDYIDEEFKELKENLEGHKTMSYDLEKVLDDWILLSILVGNDFVPNLPSLHIVKGALPTLYRTYMEVLPKLDGYINESGILNLRRFEVLLHALSGFDFEVFRSTYDDMAYMESKTGKNIVLGDKMFEDFEFDGEDVKEEALEPDLLSLINRTDEICSKIPEGNNELDEIFAGNEEFLTEEDSPEFRIEFSHHKRNYYAEKMEIKTLTKETLGHLTEEYVRAVQWVLLYYYKGVSSWGWFYPYHYAPFTSDLKQFSELRIQFDLGKPFEPFQQLLGVLPALSKKLLPEAYHELVTSKSSPLAPFYPDSFETDLNGKRQEWEAVVLIPFIDEKVLLSAVKEVEDYLTTEERLRNSKGPVCSYRYVKEETGSIMSPDNIFPPLPVSHAYETKIYEIPYDPKTLPSGIHPKAKIDLIYQGFPTLKSKPHSSEVALAEVKVFDFVAREESLILHMDVEIRNYDLNAFIISKKIIGRPVWVNWPHLTLALVTGVSDATTKFQMNEAKKSFEPDQKYNAAKEHTRLTNRLLETYKKFKGIQLTESDIIVWAKSMEGRKVRCNAVGSIVYENQWSKSEQAYPLQAIIYETSKVMALQKTQCSSFKDFFQLGQKVFVLRGTLFGLMGTVIGYEEQVTNVILEFETQTNDYAKHLITEIRKTQLLTSNDFYSGQKAATRAGISPYVFSRLTGTILVAVQKTSKPNNKKFKNGTKNTTVDESDTTDSSDELEMNHKTKFTNIGLDLKFNKKNLEVRGYTRKVDDAWLYSAKTVQLVNEFCHAFPDFIKFLSMNGASNGRQDNYVAADIFPTNSNEKIQQIVEWLDEHGVRQLEKVPLNSQILDESDIEIIWKRIVALQAQQSSSSSGARNTAALNPSLLFKPGMDSGCVTALPDSGFSLLDRVVCVDPSSTVPLGHLGTIVGIQNPVSTDAEVAFNTTTGAVVQNLVVLCDPLKDMFGPIGKHQHDLSSKLRSILNVTAGHDSNNATSTSTSAPNPPDEPKCTLIKVYPFQVMNLTKNEVLVRNTVTQSQSQQQQATSDVSAASTVLILNPLGDNKDSHEPINALLQLFKKKSETVSAEEVKESRPQHKPVSASASKSDSINGSHSERTEPTKAANQILSILRRPPKTLLPEAEKQNEVPASPAANDTAEVKKQVTPSNAPHQGNFRLLSHALAGIQGQPKPPVMTNRVTVPRKSRLAANFGKQ